jgi:hypothetical protein
VGAGHTGPPAVVKRTGRKGRRRRHNAQSGRGPLEKAKPPVLGMIERGGPVVLHLWAQVQPKTIEPLMKATMASGTRLYTDASSIDARLATWG